jgi:3-isopropylmalate/(R)-2-methylmalate dehydratase large subunit
MEFVGDGIANLRWTTASAWRTWPSKRVRKTHLPVDEKTIAYVKDKTEPSVQSIRSGRGCGIRRNIHHRSGTDSTGPLPSPHLPENTKTIDQVGTVELDQVVIGSCTNDVWKTYASLRVCSKAENASVCPIASSFPQLRKSMRMRWKKV